MDRPYIIVNVSSSLDGRIAMGPNQTMFELISDTRSDEKRAGEIWNEVNEKLKAIHGIQADMLGSNSIVKEGENLKELQPFEGDADSLYQDFLPREVINRPEHKGWLVAVDGRGRLRSGYKGEDNLEWHMLHLVSYKVAPEYLKFLQDNKIPYLIAGEDHVDLKETMKKMKDKLGVNALLTSAGGKLSGALLRQGLVDEVNVIFKPQIIGGINTPSLFDSTDLKEDERPTELKIITTQVENDGYIWLRYKVESKNL